MRQNIISNDEGSSTKMTMVVDTLESYMEKAKGTTRQKGQHDAARGVGVILVIFCSKHDTAQERVVQRTAVAHPKQHRPSDRTAASP